MQVGLKRRTIVLCNDMSSSLTLDANFLKSGGGGGGGAEPTNDMSTIIFAKSSPPPFDAYLFIVF